MSYAKTPGVRWTTADIELLPENEGTRYEVVDGDLFMTRAPHWKHQRTCGKFFRELDSWSESSGLGEASITAGVLFGESDDVIPDVVWASNERLDLLLDEAGHLTGAPELVVEVLSAGNENVRRDREAKLKLYSTRGVEEYWIADWRLKKVEVYRRENARLVLVATLMNDDELTSPLLPVFSCVVSKFFV
ncbi:Uma2 family endonuclease [Phormidium sp. LEGE 05292]|uniref:Uma2 family endonuclease n=1 Tax=[Phormidium] sp. LEGE 05292 TaxID=767427 RepID=UPI00187FC6D4|nr:Uma2 family endonuclease [Phormidium sp. LEGE 05292]MBE9224207.1 Uma2 family endonuclease [Phormidium sp. LEGE 05292]